jgi:hypothetical protein
MNMVGQSRYGIELENSDALQSRFSEHVVEPVKRPVVQNPSIVHPAVLPRTFARGEWQQRLWALQGTEEFTGAYCQRIVFCPLWAKSGRIF